MHDIFEVAEDEDFAEYKVVGPTIFRNGINVDREQMAEDYQKMRTELRRIEVVCGTLYKNAAQINNKFNHILQAQRKKYQKTLVLMSVAFILSLILSVFFFLFVDTSQEKRLLKQAEQEKINLKKEYEKKLAKRGDISKSLLSLSNDLRKVKFSTPISIGKNGKAAGINVVFFRTHLAQIKHELKQISQNMSIKSKSSKSLNIEKFSKEIQNLRSALNIEKLQKELKKLTASFNIEKFRRELSKLSSGTDIQNLRKELGKLTIGSDIKRMQEQINKLRSSLNIEKLHKELKEGISSRLDKLGKDMKSLDPSSTQEHLLKIDRGILQIRKAIATLNLVPANSSKNSNAKQVSSAQIARLRGDLMELNEKFSEAQKSLKEILKKQKQKYLRQELKEVSAKISNIKKSLETQRKGDSLKSDIQKIESHIMLVRKDLHQINNKNASIQQKISEAKKEIVSNSQLQHQKMKKYLKKEEKANQKELQRLANYTEKLAEEKRPINLKS